MIFEATYFGSSSWFINLDGLRILIDPWLTGDLFFAPGPWLINGRLNTKITVPKTIDLLLLTQGLPDHAHPASLKLLDRSIPSICSYSAGRVLEKLGFSNKTSLKPGQSKNLDQTFIEATEGAAVPGLENGYIVSSKNFSFYIEPHGFLDEKIKPRRLDAVFTPVINLKLPLAGAFIKGKYVLPKLIKKFQPKKVFASTTGGDASFTGLLNYLISIDGCNEEASNFIKDKAEFINPKVGEIYQLNDYINQ
ncbi:MULTISPECIES: MBL fold metallo-hydrolase [Prochlorococcus]|uniref:Inactivated Zn-dependent hydrolase of the beta-lactamase fold n=1 Tax=Prochlorococcus marinus (strain SARG / CCMP1375 / SS120) TaxID=167539 RepID=Q7VBB0_PROMA|nr:MULTISPECIES: MBL fold metallo-hydrolase [Prochlorococcus]AAQ00232.1 Inactivated Zn-dependent hydrolase of the beta-lactamase fold [Prochlorococcus marinus subsp. marinus str. CCMP1375]KGG14033.1 Inactivated Zn-dependent hydrolase of the beta-lactamase fold [Prochlorococcus marinus str. LG]KGG19165.1 Inactivated Zn-dependent hydrolase of the beta-lactamase fold [Prochlorococcus marinus str. SS2]KGG23294.1 Inactivated Zn-dependent hydrolase of the beta-lactamase fold [Prochlorococcus marinus 